MKKQVGNAQLMQKMNRIKVLELVKKNEVIARPKVSSETGLSLSSVTNIVTYLIDKNIIKEIGMEHVERVGRKSTLLQFNYSAYNFICIKIDINKITIALTDLSGKINGMIKEEITNTNPEFVLTVLKKELNKLIKDSEASKILAIGVAISGLVLDNGRTFISSSLKWSSFKLKEEIEDYTGMPVIVENISVTNALFSFNKQKATEYNNVVLIDLENGIGAVQIYNGKINRSVIGEIGHTTIEKNGEQCFCGNKGCFEVMCSFERIVSLVRKGTDNQKMAIDDVIFAIENDCEQVREIVDDCIEYLGIAVANIIDIFNPQKIIINGAEYFKSDYIYQYIISCVKRRVNAFIVGELSIEKVNIDDCEKIIGIARYMSDAVFDISFPYNIIE